MLSIAIGPKEMTISLAVDHRDASHVDWRRAAGPRNQVCPGDNNYVALVTAENVAGYRNE